ncbi:MAG TPA: pyridoxamine 5'-phosphate oxidase family protein [Acidimicrobiia bacterium]|nr:pyridoxamine 5'-phosphate oxidase family protein [Acidimicrobiia bacterium]
MHETPADTASLQRLLDESYARIGSHMRSIHTPERRVAASDLARVLRGVRVLDLATVTSKCEPRVSPVDGLFFRGRFYFGSGEESMRFRHLRARPQVSACHTIGETFATIVHGRAFEIDVRAAEQRDFLAYVHEVYPDWDEWYAGENPPYARIEPDVMYAYAFEPSVLEGLRGI